MRKGSRVVFVLSVLILVIGVGSVAYAASSYTINSNGVLRYDGNNDGDFTDSEDVVFDSNDLVNIGNEVNVLKTGLEGYESQLQTVASDVEQLRNDVDSVNESLGGVSQFIVDESTGKITGYKTKAGADTVFPFKGLYSISDTPDIFLTGSDSSGSVLGTLCTVASEKDAKNTAYNVSNGTITFNEASTITIIVSSHIQTKVSAHYSTVNKNDVTVDAIYSASFGEYFGELKIYNIDVSAGDTIKCYVKGTYGTNICYAGFAVFI